MNNIILIRSALRSLQHHKGRSLLTMLGIIVGIAAIIATLAIGYGAEKKMRDNILARGNKSISMWQGRFGEEGASKSTKRKPPKRLRLEDIESLKQQCPDIYKISPFLWNQGVIEFQGTNLKTRIKGGNKDFLFILGRKIKRGTFFSEHQAQKGSRVIIIGEKVAQELFKTQNPIGQTVKVKGIPFTVIGIVDTAQSFLRSFRDPNLDTFVPFRTAKKYFNKSTSTTVHSIEISTRTYDVMPKLVRQIKLIMRARHNLDQEDLNDFTVIDQKSELDAAKASSSIFNLFLLIVASISLLVGGIGVMNIMLVSVTERTKEIGIRMALGAYRRTILKQFLIESVTLCSIGGFLGIIVGVIAPHVAHYFAKFPVVIKPQAIIIAVITILLIGILFGYYPARKAANLNPVQALTEQ